MIRQVLRASSAVSNATHPKMSVWLNGSLDYSATRPFPQFFWTRALFYKLFPQLKRQLWGSAFRSPFQQQQKRFFFRHIVYVRNFMQKRRLHLKVHQKTGRRTGVTLRLVRRAWSALSESVPLENLQTAHSPYYIHDWREASLQAIISRGDGYLPRFQRKTLDEMERAVTSERKVNNAAY